MNTTDLLQSIGLRPAWHADALCLEHPEVNWFPARGEPAAPAKAICARCLVRDECAAYAITHNEYHGIWGGLTVAELQRRRRKAA